MLIILKYLKNLIIESPGKSITLAVTIVSFIFAGTFDYTTETRNVLAQNIIVEGLDTTHTYLYKSEGNITCVSFHKAQKILPGNIITYQESNVGNMLLWIVFGIGVIVLVFGTFGDSQVNWEFKENWKETLYGEVKVIEEEGKYHWVLRNRLLWSESDVNNSPRYVRDRVEDYIDNKNIFPRFRTKQEKRNNKLDKIGIS